MSKTANIYINKNTGKTDKIVYDAFGGEPEEYKTIVDNKRYYIVDSEQKVPIMLLKEYQIEIHKSRPEKIVVEPKGKKKTKKEKLQPIKIVKDITKRKYIEIIENQDGVEPEVFLSFLKGGNEVIVYPDLFISVNGTNLKLSESDYSIFKLLCKNSMKDSNSVRDNYTTIVDIEIELEKLIDYNSLEDDSRRFNKPEQNRSTTYKQVDRLMDKLQCLPVYDRKILPIETLDEEFIERKNKEEQEEAKRSLKRKYANKKRKTKERIIPPNIIINHPNFGYRIFADPKNIKFATENLKLY